MQKGQQRTQNTILRTIAKHFQDQFEHFECLPCIRSRSSLRALSGLSTEWHEKNRQKKQAIKIKIHGIQGKCTRGVVDMHVAPTPRASIWACFKHRLLNLQTLLREAKVFWKCANPFLYKLLGETRKRHEKRNGHTSIFCSDSMSVAVVLPCISGAINNICEPRECNENVEHEPFISSRACSTFA